jgi:hypothetical protein
MDLRTKGRICKEWKQKRSLGKRRFAQRTSQEPAPASFVERVPEAGSCSSVAERAVGALGSPPDCFTPSPFPGGSHLLAASRLGPSLPPPAGKPSAGSCWPSTRMRVHLSRDAGRRGVSGEGKPPRFCLECRGCAWANPRSVLLAAFSRPLSRSSPLLDRAPRLGLWCAEEISSAQGSIGVPSLYLLTRLGEEARKGRGAGGDQLHLPALSAFRTSSCLGRRNRTCTVTLLAVHACTGYLAYLL